MRYIDRIENDKWTRKHDRIPGKSVELNRIIIHFTEKSNERYICAVVLKNELGNIINYNSGTDESHFSGNTDIKTLYLCFDNCDLEDNSTFMIVFKIDSKEKRITFTLTSGMWESDEVDEDENNEPTNI